MMDGYESRPKHISKLTPDELKLEKELVRKKKAKVLQYIDQTKHLSQGFRLVNQKDYQSELARLKSELTSKQFLSTEEGQVSKLMYDILTDDAHLVEYLDDDLKSYLIKPSVGKAKLDTKSMTQAQRNQVANTKLKRKQLFLMYKEIIHAQVELRTFAKTVASAFNGELSEPPGAFGGIKSFSGALAKMTTRDRDSYIGELKDCARMTVMFDSLTALHAAKLFICRTEEFRKVAHNQNALKDRYSFAKGKSSLAKYSKGATGSGYRDIKFFLQLSSGQIAELQLNIPGMLVAKAKEHIIYDITRTTKDLSKEFKVSSQEVLDTVKRKMDKNWFSFIHDNVPKARDELKIAQNMIHRLHQSGSLIVSPKEAEALNKIGRELYAQGMNGRALLGH
ncbi:hypothetical protein [Vibrio sp. TBV020]|uniref:hypothetical protein n=1 Tax=Vibrio sp. TBV020 TaxID=3137398 RepID=UPI0038CDBC3E